MRSTNDRRLKRIYIPPNKILNLTINWKSRENCIGLIHFPDLPQDVVIDSVWWDYSRQVFGVILYHETFPIVPETANIPEIDDTFERFFIPACKDLNEARRLAMWASKSEDDRAAETIAKIITKDPLNEPHYD